MQKFILKVFYGMQLQQNIKTIQLNDMLNSKRIGLFTQSDFLKYLIDERRTNLTNYQPGQKRRQLVLSCGRRSSKCQSVQTEIYTTKGIITVGQLFDRFVKGQKIGVFTLKDGKIIQTFDIDMEQNGERQCLKVYTTSGKSQQTTLNHPYLVWNEDMFQPQWVQAKDLKVGDLLACPTKVGSFGNESIGKNKAKILETSNDRLRTNRRIVVKKALRCAKMMNDNIIMNYCNDNIKWEKISQIKNTGIHKTIALQVKDTNIIVNEIITHNSVLASIISNYQTYRLVKMDNPQDYFGFPSGQEIAITTVATTDEQATTLFDMIKARGVNCSFLKDRIANKTQTYFNLMTDNDVRKNSSPSIKLLCGGSASASLRGKNNLVVIFDEAAFFQQGVKNSGQQIYNSLTPSIASFTKDGIGQGKIILLSSPYAKSGLFYNKYCQSFQDEQNMLMFQMYTAMVNPTVDSAFLRSQYRKNKQSFMCEFGAQFSDTITSWMTQNSLRQAIDRPDIVQNKKQGQRGKQYYMGIDYGGKTDGTSICIVHKQEQQIILDYADVFFSGSSDVWDSKSSIYKECSKQFSGYQIIPINGIADKIKTLCDKFYIVDGWFDQFNGYGLMQALKQRGLTQFRLQAMSNGLNTQIFQLSKMLINSGFIKLFNHPVLIPQLLTLQQEKNGSSVSVQAPRRAGYHDDISDAFCRAVWSCHNSTNKKNTKHCSSGLVGHNGINSNSRSYQAYQIKKMRMHDNLFTRKNLGV